MKMKETEMKLLPVKIQRASFWVLMAFCDAISFGQATRSVIAMKMTLNMTMMIMMMMMTMTSEKPPLER